jgi:sortase (surface protein transpeptidase)
MAAAGATVATGGRLAANTGTQLPVWGETPGSTDLQAGPLGLNPAIDPGQVPVAIRIPDASVDAEVERQQIVDGKMLDPSGPWVVAWYEQTARAGAIGNCVASGHVDYWGVGPSVFYTVAEIPEGALIDITGKNGAVYTYEVTSISRVDLTSITVEELNSPEVVGRTDYPALTLITCGGNFNGQEYTQRDIIRGQLVSVQGVEEEVATEEAEGEEPSAGDVLAEGAEATINTDGVNLRSEPTTGGDVVQVLNSGTVVTITGESADADDYTWWPVQLEDGTSGYVVADFLTP